MTNLLQRKPLLASILIAVVSISFQTAFSQMQVVTESDIVRQPEGTPPTNNWVGYTRAGTPPSAILFVNGPGMPPAGCGSVQFSTLTPTEKAYLFNYDHVGKRLADIDKISYYTYRTTG